MTVPYGQMVTKVVPPPARVSDVPRRAVVDRLLGDDAANVVAVVAPAGYGKTTVLAQWSAQQHREVAWVSLDDADNDPAVLIADAMAALARARLIEPAVADGLASPAGSMTDGLGHIASAMRSITTPMTFVLDHVERVSNPTALDLINELALGLPAASRLAVATRAVPPLPTALLRSRGEVVEVGIDDLTMDVAEAAQLLEGAGANVSATEVAWLVDQTEGWPAGLYLAALALRTSSRPNQAPFGVRGDDRVIGDYLRSEILSHLAPDTVAFLTRTAILEHLSGPLCDAVLDREGSQAMLEWLEASNLLVVPLDGHRAGYRYHRLFRTLLLAELQRTESSSIPVLHARAADWLAANRMLEPAIGHAQQAGDAERVAGLVMAAAQPAFASGRATTVRGWFEWFRTEGLIESFPGIAVLGGVLEALAGRPAAAERWQAAVADLGGPPLPDGSPPAAWWAYLRALTSRDGTAAMRQHARLAARTLSPHSPFRAAVLLLEGISYVIDGDDEVAEPVLARACDTGEYGGGAGAAAAAWAERGLIAARRGEWDRATHFAERALAIVDAHDLDTYVQAALVHTLAARTAIHAGDLRAGRDHLAHAARLRPLMTYAVPATTQFQLELARSYLQLGDTSGARTLLRDVRDNLSQLQAMGRLVDDADELRTALDLARQRTAGTSTLSVAELRVLPYLATHLSFREIGARLFLSQHTIKTQAMAIYRKLGVSSRSEAIARATEAGLLDG